MQELSFWFNIVEQRNDWMNRDQLLICGFTVILLSSQILFFLKVTTSYLQKLHLKRIKQSTTHIAMVNVVLQE